MEFAVAQWSSVIPSPLRESFASTFLAFADDHERALKTIENIWTKRDQAYVFDESTGLARRQPFLDHLASLLTRADSAGSAIGVLFLDLDGLKAINDRHGHDAGDRAITAAGRIVREAIRVEGQIDVIVRAADECSIARHGGDEFLIAVELREPEDIRVIAPRIKARVDDRARQRAHGYDADEPFTVSLGGVVCTRGPGRLPASVMVRELIATADSQMYSSKRDGLVHIAMARFTDHLEVERREAFACEQAAGDPTAAMGDLRGPDGDDMPVQPGRQA
jgi:diguanylate cyclase (GGDEF)-like protein